MSEVRISSPFSLDHIISALEQYSLLYKKIVGIFLGTLSGLYNFGEEFRWKINQKM